MAISYSQYVIGRNFVKLTGYEKINTGRRKQAAQVTQPATPMTTQELDVAYQYGQRAKREKLLRLADVNFEAGACTFITLTFKENLNDYDKAVKVFKLFTKKLRRKLEDVRYIAYFGDSAERRIPFSPSAQCSRCSIWSGQHSTTMAK